MNTLEFIIDRYSLNPNDNPIKISQSRWHDMGHLFNDLGFKKGVEVGVYKARFTACLAKRMPNCQIIGIDAWTVYKGYKDYENTDLESVAQKEAEQRTKGFPNVKLIKAWSQEAVKTFEDESLDFVFIDANHDFECVVADIAAWSKKVCKGGIVCGHDYFKNKRHNFGVVEAVDAWCLAYDIKPLLIWTDNCPNWMYVK